ncbi:MAG: EamA family transporter [Bacteroidota bacterium]
MSERTKVFLAYLAICTIWGSTWLVIKIGLEYIPPLISAGMRFAVAAVVLWGIIKYRAIDIPLHKEAKEFYLLVALTSFAVPFALVYWGEQKISSGLTSILFAVYPFCVALFSAFILRQERLTIPKIGGIVFGFGGIVTIFGSDVQFGASTETLLGMGAIVLSAISQAFSAVMIKKRGREISPFVVTFAPMFLSAIFLLAAGGLTEDLAAVHLNAVSISSILFLAVFGSVTTFVSYFWLIKRVQVVFLSLTSFVTPIIAVVLGIIILNEKVSPQLFAGSGLVLLGILIANSGEFLTSKRKRHHAGN